MSEALAILDKVGSTEDQPLSREQAVAIARDLRGNPGLGRPTNLNQAVAIKIVKAVAEGSYFSVACAAAGVAERTGHEWIKRGEADTSLGLDTDYALFAQALAQGSAEAEVEAAAVLQRGGDGKFKDWRAPAWWLERRHRDRWAEPKEQLNSGVTIVITADLASQLADAMAVAAATHVIDAVATSSTSDPLPSIEQGPASTDPAQSKD